MSKNKSAVTYQNMIVESWPIDKIVPYDRNAKIHSESQISKLASIIEKNGFRVPIRIDEAGVIIAGHGRRLAMLSLQRKYPNEEKYKTIPAIVERGLTESEKNAARIADNKVASQEYDKDLLSEEILLLNGDDDFDLDLLGMDSDEIGSLLIVEDVGAEMNIEDSLGTGDEESHSLEPKLPKEVEYKPSWMVMANCKNEAEQKAVYELLTEHGYSCSIQTM